MQPHVLVVDDDEAVRAVVSELLRAEGIGAECACDGAEVLQILRAGEVPDLLLLDLIMPKVDGWGVLDALRGELRLEELPVIVLTSFGAPVDLPAGILSLHKPVDPGLLLERVDAELNPRRP